MGANYKSRIILSIPAAKAVVNEVSKMLPLLEEPSTGEHAVSFTASKVNQSGLISPNSFSSQRRVHWSSQKHSTSTDASSSSISRRTIVDASCALLKCQRTHDKPVSRLLFRLMVLRRYTKFYLTIWSSSEKATTKRTPTRQKSLLRTNRSFSTMERTTAESSFVSLRYVKILNQSILEPKYFPDQAQQRLSQCDYSSNVCSRRFPQGVGQHHRQSRKKLITWENLLLSEEYSRICITSIEFKNLPPFSQNLYGICT